MVHRLSMMNWHGDSVITWTLDEVEVLAEAERIFDEARAQGAFAYAIDAAGDASQMDTWDPEAVEIVLHRPMVGG